ncbi:Fe-S oxidoreductase [Desulfacinum hydrothermale DSM 13146]|uniref:Fe-S oxidoreductase n=1 Tax=Desulfacinum hydrothermale DSM 13146 TaxID=1121390 RepID=A0A1W1XM03_9BACT|nr:(Fe-S)-binding protein [Desulfacinum hydrothermale]SMC24558.1 Fe-S oxidoreductase [Desulfacinum hydrothermale DSM 13146]
MEPKYVSAEMRDYIVSMGAETVNWCMQCGLCTNLCPWRLVPGETSEKFNIRHMQRLGQMGMEGFEDETVLFACSTCGMCQSNCPRGVKIIDNVRGMRASIVGAGMAPANLRPILGSAHANGNPWSGPREKRTAWQEGLDVPTFGPDTEYFLFVCCHSCYDPRSTKVARSIVKLLQAAGVSFGVIGQEESCCGESMRKLGDEELFQKLAQSNIELFNSKGVKKIITTSPHCLWTFTQEYPELGGEWEVIHYTELLNQLVEEGKLSLKAGQGKKVAFHDPCYLGRHSGVYDPPRALLEKVVPDGTVELTRNRESSLCCAGGGGRIWAEVPMGERFGELRVTDALDQGAQVLATACPYCMNMLIDACNSLGKEDDLEVVELSEILADSL